MCRTGSAEKAVRDIRARANKRSRSHCSLWTRRSLVSDHNPYDEDAAHYQRNGTTTLFATMDMA